MNKFFILSILCTTFICNAQKKDYTQKELSTNKRVLEFSKENNTKVSNTINFLKCVKSESGLKMYKNLPFFTGKLPLIIDKRLKQHNTELWEGIHEHCNEKHISTILF